MTSLTDLQRAERDEYEARKAARLSPFSADRERFLRIAQGAADRVAQARHRIAGH
ncbi:hypothetical protein [Brevundimonas sp.]|uniref:hypothetical protein n=1 Tax=Brevundimonas sp. TaxID=1871086 RepID=UPI0035B2F4E6